MTRFYDLEAANAAVPELDGILTLRDEVLARGGTGDGAPTLVGDELRLTRLRMQGLIDQMAAGVARIDEMGLTLRDIEHGLVDFPALVSGRQVWLCWQRGEAVIDWWHGLDTGFAGRRPLTELT